MEKGKENGQKDGTILDEGVLSALANRLDTSLQHNISLQNQSISYILHQVMPLLS